MSQNLKDWIEIDIKREYYDDEGFCFWEKVGRVYERKCFAYRLAELARGRVLKHAMYNAPGTYIAVVNGIGEVARATSVSISPVFRAISHDE